MVVFFLLFSIRIFFKKVRYLTVQGAGVYPIQVKGNFAVSGFELGIFAEEGGVPAESQME